jgi:hypothetical protein
MGMNEDIYIGIGMIMYIWYNVLLNWVYIKEYINKGSVKDKKSKVIRRGMEWPEL